MKDIEVGFRLGRKAKQYENRFFERRRINFMVFRFPFSFLLFYPVYFLYFWFLLFLFPFSFLFAAFTYLFFLFFFSFLKCLTSCIQPHEIIINDGSKLTLHGILQHFVPVEEKDKTQKLAEILDNVNFRQCIIFVESPKRAQTLNDILVDMRFPAECAHSRMRQDAR